MLAPQTAAMQDDHQIVRPVILATDVEADPARVFEALSTTQGQQSFPDRRLRGIRHRSR